MTPRPVVRVDDRESGSPVAAALASSGRVEVRVARLGTGDYAVESVGVERKAGDDFALSIVDRRLFRQASRMTAVYARPMIVVEGSSGRVAAAAQLGAIVSLAAVFGVPVLTSRGPEETTRIIEFAATQATRRAGASYARPGHRPKGRRARQAFVLQGLPGVGPVRAARLLDRFGSIHAVIAATPDELESVPGVGRGVSRAIRDLVS